MVTRFTQARDIKDSNKAQTDCVAWGIIGFLHALQANKSRIKEKWATFTYAGKESKNHRKIIKKKHTNIFQNHEEDKIPSKVKKHSDAFN
jgi:hypothetical protein